MNTGQGRFGGRRGGNRGNYNRGGVWNQGNFRGHARGGPRGFSRGVSGGQRGFQRNNPPWNQRKREMPTKRLTEEEIGVTEYLSDHEGFNGIIKSRYSDFQVSEINEKGEIAKLTDLSTPEPPKEEPVNEDEQLFSKYNLEILPIETWDAINKLLMTEKPTDEKVEIDVTGMSKEQRTKIHDAVKKAFTDAIVGSTVTVEDKKFVRFERYRKGVRIDNRVKWNWPGEYLYFIVHKENCDTMEAAVKIAERLRLNIKPTMLGYAGTKDRRAKTSQWFSLKKTDPRRVAAACKDMREIHVGNFSFSAENLKLGSLKGNQFRIALRNVTADDSIIDKACELLRDVGFINYYGLQRFGVRRDTPTYVVGRKLLQGRMQEAIDSILEERPGEPPAPRSSRHVEATLLKALAKAPNDLVGALNKMSRNTRLLYLHSYQSFIWNCAVSRRLRTLGNKPAVGDLVPLARVNEVISDDLGGIDSDEDEDQEMTEKKSESETATSTTEKKEKDSKQDKVPVKILNQDDIDSGRYTIFDVVMPLPGYNIEYPPNMKDYYEELLKKDDLTLELRHKIKSYSMSGAYRHLLARPRGLRWRSVRYGDPRADLILSDLDLVQERRLTGILPDGKYKALLLTMSLPASCYATMALRELLRVDTSSHQHAAQNNYHGADRKRDREGADKKDVTESGTEEIKNGGAENKTTEEETLEIAAKKSKMSAATDENYT